jgi:hypothetical protein
MDLVVDVVSRGLKLFEERVQKSQEGVDGGETRDGGVTREIDHGLIDILISDILSGCLIVLVLVDTVEFLPDVGTDGILIVLAALDSL